MSLRGRLENKSPLSISVWECYVFYSWCWPHYFLVDLYIASGSLGWALNFSWFINFFCESSLLWHNQQPDVIRRYMPEVPDAICPLLLSLLNSGYSNGLCALMTLVSVLSTKGTEKGVVWSEIACFVYLVRDSVCKMQRVFTRRVCNL